MNSHFALTNVNEKPNGDPDMLKAISDIGQIFNGKNDNFIINALGSFTAQYLAQVGKLNEAKTEQEIKNYCKGLLNISKMCLPNLRKQVAQMQRKIN